MALHRGILASLVVVLTSSCLVLDDYTLVEGDAGVSPCSTPDSFQCSGQTLQVCRGGRWLDEESCAADKVCSAEVGACICQDGAFDCRDEVLRRCEGGMWIDQTECSRGQVCSEERGGCVCATGTFACVGLALQRCSDGMWSVHETCSQEQVCSEELGDCLACEPEEDYMCEGTELRRCAADGSGYEPFKNCAEEGERGLLCDTELVPDDCFECRGPERRCMGNLLAKCIDYSFGSGGTVCSIDPGCIVSEDGDDYCAQCPTPGEEVCRNDTERRRCTEDYQWETFEQCAGRCVPSGTTSRCEDAAE